MSHGRAARNPSPAGLARLFDGSSLVGLADGELLARFVATRDKSAFEGLVVRLGPMVLGVCRRMLPDRADADDAFQATFLVLVRRAGSVGRGDLIGPWLHGVAVRVCRRARGRGARRRLVERTGVEVDALPPSSSPFVESAQLDRAEIRATIDSEIARLPETYRRLVILCDVEGLTRSEAADRLGWTPNMVRGRLARARTRLRAGLTHRGCTPPGLAPSTIEASGLAILPWTCSPPPTLIVITARAAMATLSPSGRTLAATLASTSALSLAEGVIRAMFVTSWKFVGAGLITAGTLAAGSSFLIAQSSPDPRSNPAPPPTAAAPTTPGPGSQVPAVNEVQLRLIAPPDLSLYLVRPDLAFYLENKGAFPGLTDSFLALCESESETNLPNNPQPPTPAELEAAIPPHIARIKDLQRDLKTQDLADPLIKKKLELVRLALEQAETRGSTNRPNSDHPDLKALREEHLRNARYRHKVQQSFYDEGRITANRLIDASRQVMQAEQVLAVTPQERRASLRMYVDRLKQMHDKELREREFGRATEADVTEIADVLLEARILLAQQTEEGRPQADATAGPAPTPKTSQVGKNTASEAVATINRTRVELARKLYEATAELFSQARCDAVEVAVAGQALARAELAAATSPEGRAVALRAFVTQAQEALAVIEELAGRGGKKQSDVLKMRIALLDAQALAAGGGVADPQAPGNLDRRLTDVEQKVDRILDLLNSLPDRVKKR